MRPQDPRAIMTELFRALQTCHCLWKVTGAYSIRVKVPPLCRCPVVVVSVVRRRQQQVPRAGLALFGERQRRLLTGGDAPVVDPPTAVPADEAGGESEVYGGDVRAVACALLLWGCLGAAQSPLRLGIHLYKIDDTRFLLDFRKVEGGIYDYFDACTMLMREINV